MSPLHFQPPVLVVFSSGSTPLDAPVLVPATFRPYTGREVPAFDGLLHPQWAWVALYIMGEKRFAVHDGREVFTSSASDAEVHQWLRRAVGEEWRMRAVVLHVPSRSAWVALLDEAIAFIRECSSSHD